VEPTSPDDPSVRAHRSVLETAKELRDARRLPRPWEGKHTFVWPLEGEPALLVKVLGTPKGSVMRNWLWAISVFNTLEATPGLIVPRVRSKGASPVPWLVQEMAPGSPGTTLTMTPLAALDVVNKVQRTTLFHGPRVAVWGPREYSANLRRPLAALEKAGVISPSVVKKALQVATLHLERLVLVDPVFTHNDLAIHHVFTGQGGHWLIDWAPHLDRLGMIDVAHLMINHGTWEPAWARELASLAMARNRSLLGDDLAANLVVSLIERAVGRAYEWRRRWAQQSAPAMDALFAILEGELVPLQA